MHAGYNHYCTVALYLIDARGKPKLFSKIPTVWTEIKSAIEKQQYGKCKL